MTGIKEIAMRSKITLVVLWLAALGTVCSKTVWAECVTRTAIEVLHDPDVEVVFLGTATSVTRTGEYGYRATFSVDRVWKGSVSNPFSHYVWERSAESAGFDVGRTFVVQARRMLARDARRDVGITDDDATVFTPIAYSGYFAFPPTVANLRALGPDTSNQPVILLANCDSRQQASLSIDNVGHEDVAVIVGATLGNGRHLISALTLQADSEGRHDVFIYGPADSPTRIGGRLDPWVIPLPVGSSYMLHVGSTDFRSKVPGGGIGKRLTDWPAGVLSFELSLLTPESAPGDPRNPVRTKIWDGDSLRSNRISVPLDCREAQ